MVQHRNKIGKDIKAIIKAYEHLVLGIDQRAQNDISQRAYGGIVRAGKGKLVESITMEIVKIAWDELSRDASRLEINRKKIKVPIKKTYITKIKNPVVRKYILKNADKYFYRLSTDLHIFIDGKFILAIECKSYTENAMLKRILVDFSLLKQVHKVPNFVLFQMESQLGGDYSKLKDITLGSCSTHTLLSYFDVELNILTLLEGERKVDKPIHKKSYYKKLQEKNLLKAISLFKNILTRY